MAHDAAGQPLREFPAQLVHLGHARVDVEHPAAWAPTVVRRPFPRLRRRVVWAPVEQALLAAIPVDLTTNFG